MRTYKSPGRPPWDAFPSPLSLRFWPSSAPGGILTCNFFLALSSPVPLQVLQGRSIIVPSPLHLGQVVIWTNWAKPVRRIFWTRPCPLHSLQVFRPLPACAPVPLQVRHSESLGTS